MFIIGHWRTGTTLLHELLANDPRLVAPNLLQCYCPSHFLISRRFSRLIKLMLPDKRPMDGIDIRLDSPQEDEFAQLLNGHGSPLEMFGYPAERKIWSRWFRPPASRVIPWLNTLDQFLKSVALEHNMSSGLAPENLLLKSPTHTARLALLAKHFPSAKFIHLTRNPLDLFSSTATMVHAFIATQSLSLPATELDELTDEIVLENLEQLYSNFERDCRELEPGRLHNLKYEELTAKPVEAVRSIYEFLGIPFEEEVAELIGADLAARRHYTAAKHEIPPEIASIVLQRWKPYSKAFGYLEP